jgi:YVTN family beta-propeller protein
VLRSRIAQTIAIASVGLLVLPGCGSGGKSRREASTTAPTTSGTPAPTTSTAPITTATTPPTTTPPASTMLTDALVSSFSLKELIQVDAATGATSNRWALGDGPTDVANHGFFAYSANTLSQDVTVVDRLANNVVTTIDVTSVPVTGISLLGFLDPILKPMVRPTGIAVTPNGAKAFTANLLNVTVIDTTTNRPVKSILGLAPLNLSTILSNPLGAVQSFLAAPVQGLGMAKVAATNDYAMVTCMITGKVMRIDARTNSVVDYTAVGRAPIGITIARNKAYVACAMSQEIAVVDVATGRLLRTLQAGMIPVDAASNQAEDKVYIANAISGDITVIDTAADIVVDTLPAGLSIAGIFQQMGITVPTGTSGGISGLLNGFLQGFTGGMTNPGSFGNLITGGGGSLLSPGNLINGLLSAFLAYAGINQGALAGMNLPAFGIFSVAVAHNPTYVCSANAFMGTMGVTEIASRNVNSLMGLTGLGPADVSTVWRR